MSECARIIARRRARVVEVGIRKCVSRSCACRSRRHRSAHQKVAEQLLPAHLTRTVGVRMSLNPVPEAFQVADARVVPVRSRPRSSRRTCAPGSDTAGPLHSARSRRSWCRRATTDWRIRRCFSRVVHQAKLPVVNVVAGVLGRDAGPAELGHPVSRHNPCNPRIPRWWGVSVIASDLPTTARSRSCSQGPSGRGLHDHPITFGRSEIKDHILELALPEIGEAGVAQHD